MADITMCEGNNCPLKDRCFRYTATANEHWQSWMGVSPYIDGSCELYWPNDNYEDERPKHFTNLK